MEELCEEVGAEAVHGHHYFVILDEKQVSVLYCAIAMRHTCFDLFGAFLGKRMIPALLKRTSILVSFSRKAFALALIVDRSARSSSKNSNLPLESG